MHKANIDLNILSSVVDNVGAYIYTKNLKGEYTYANQLVLNLFNTNLENLMGKDDYHFFDSPVVEDLLENDRHVFLGNIIETQESLILKEDGLRREYLVVKKPLFDKDNKIIGMFGISTDITEQKLLEKKISDQKKLLDAVLDNVDAYIYIKDEHRVFRYANSKVAKLFQKDIDNLIGKKDIQIIDKKTADSFWESDIEVLAKQKKHIIEEQFENEEGTSYYWSIKIPYNLDGTRCILGFSTDITDLKQKDLKLKEQDKILNQQAKLSAMGEMIENIAHQWRQPLCVISSVSTGIQLSREKNIYNEEQLRKGLDSITNSVDYLSDTIEYFRDYLHKNQEKSRFYIEDIINKTLDLILIDLETNGIEIKKTVEKHELFSFQNDLIQILLNIIMNAKDAFKEKNIKNRQIKILVLKKDTLLNIEIYDNAGGIKEEIISRIFEPYFTTKHKSQGTGIGLFMCQQIVNKHLKGSLDVKNSTLHNEKGACFNLKLPLDNLI